MTISKAKLPDTMKLALATAVAALWMAAVPVGGASAAWAGYPVDAARARALQACGDLADEWGYAYRACMAQHGQEE